MLLPNITLQEAAFPHQDISIAGFSLSITLFYILTYSPVSAAVAQRQSQRLASICPGLDPRLDRYFLFLRGTRATKDGWTELTLVLL